MTIGNIVDLGSLSASQGLIIDGASGSFAGSAVSSAGDINGDGISDIIIGAYAANSRAGAAYVIYGKKEGLQNINLGNLNLSQDFTLSGISDSAAGSSVSSAGDINGDGISDIIIGASGANSHAGAAYVIYGKKGDLENINLGNLNPSQGFTLSGISDSWAGSSISSAGDINGDGISDIIIGASGANSGAGAAYVNMAKRKVFKISILEI